MKKFGDCVADSVITWRCASGCYDTELRYFQTFDQEALSYDEGMGRRKICTEKVTRSRQPHRWLFFRIDSPGFCGTA